MILDAVLPRWDVRERHTAELAAPPAAVLDAAKAVSPREIPLFLVLMALRNVPDLLAGTVKPTLGGSLLDGFISIGFVELGDSDDEVVVGAVGRFWRLRSDILPLEADEFVRFDEPGFAKAVLNFQVAEVAGATLLSTETRVLATDDTARRAFSRYWLIIRPASGAIRRAFLRAVRRRVVRTQGVRAGGR